MWSLPQALATNVAPFTDPGKPENQEATDESYLKILSVTKLPFIRETNKSKIFHP